MIKHKSIEKINHQVLFSLKTILELMLFFLCFHLFFCYLIYCISKLFIIKHNSNKDIVEVLLQKVLFTVSGHDLWLGEVIQLRGLYHQFTGIVVISKISPELTVVGL